MSMPIETVTFARVRTFDMPRGAGRMALITLDNDKDHTRPTTFGPEGLMNLKAAMETIKATPDLAAVAVTGKPFIFAVGADLSGTAHVTERSQILEFARLGHDVLRMFGELGIPSFAFINGAAMGGGTEVALQCDYRTLSSSAAALSLPEVSLGLVPGWGGAYLLPRLIGPERALEIIINNPLAQNKQLKPKDALRMGVVDIVLDAADFLERSIDWAAQIITGDIHIDRPALDVSSWEHVVDAATQMLDARLHGATPAPYRALELVRAAATSDRSTAFDAEDESLADLVMGEDFRSSMYSFDLIQRRAKKPVGAPDKELARPIRKVGIVGAGLMASQLALLFARKLQVPVVMTDLDQARVDKGLAFVAQDVSAQVDKKRMTPDKAARITSLVSGTTSLDEFAQADFVIEAVFEELDVKRQVFARLEDVVRPDCIIATNTSSLSVAAMAEGLTHPERVVGFHFFNPVGVMPLLEIARTPQTDDATMATAFATGKALGKSCVLVKDSPAFVVNRLLTRFMGEITAAMDEGTDPLVADRAMEPLGLPMTPFFLLQLVGPAVAFHVSETLHAAFPDRFPVSDNLRRLVEAGKRGLWTWDSDGVQTLDPEVAALMSQGTTPSSAEQIRVRTLDALADEVRRMLDEGVVAEPQDIDLCMLLGAGWPLWLGGITPYLDRSGASERVTGRRFLPPGVASLPR